MCGEQVLSRCQTSRPLVCALVRALPEHIQSRIPGTRIAQGVLSDIPIQVVMPNEFRLCVSLLSAHFTLNIPRCISFIDAYVSNRMNSVGEDAEKTTAVRKMLESACRHLIGDGLNVFLATKVCLESDSAEHDIMLSLSTPSLYKTRDKKLQKVDQHIMHESHTSSASDSCVYSAIKVSATAGLYDIIDDMNALMSVDMSRLTSA